MALKREISVLPKIFSMLKYILKNLTSRNILNISLDFRNFSLRGWLHGKFQPGLKNSYKVIKEKNKTERTELCDIKVVLAATATFGGRNQLLKSVNQKAVNGISESLQWRFRGIQGVKHHVVICSSSFCASWFNILLWVSTEQCQSMVHSLPSAICVLYLLVIKGNFPNDLSFSLCKSIRGDTRKRSTKFTQFALCHSSCK